MSNQENYHIPMSNMAFEDVKENATKIWGDYSDEFGYASEKINRIKDIENIGDNALFIIGMFDDNNIVLLLSKLQERTLEELLDKRLPDYLIPVALIFLSV